MCTDLYDRKWILPDKRRITGKYFGIIPEIRSAQYFYGWYLFTFKNFKKTLYQFFSNKDDLVEQVLLQRRDSRRIQKDLEQLKQHTSIEIMLSIRDHIITSLNSQMPANLFDLKKYHPDIYQRVNEKDQIFIQNLFHEVIEKGIREGYFRNDIHREVQVYLFVKQMAFLGEPEMMSEIKYPLDIIVSTIVENVIRSFATPRGIEELEKIT